jgi:Sodium/hydrogen exchanger family
VLSLVVPGLGLAAGVALGAIVSPTDAVATSIVRRVGVTPRVVTVLEGESLLNDATALVVLRAGVAATAATVSVGAVAGARRDGQHRPLVRHAVRRLGARRAGARLGAGGGGRRGPGHGPGRARTPAAAAPDLRRPELADGGVRP